MYLSISFKRVFTLGLVFLISSNAEAGEVSEINESYFSHVEQLTSPSLSGFEKAGEAYFSPDSKMIIFQAVLKGEENYKIFTMNLETKEVTKVSGDLKACTCSFFRPDGEKIIFAGSPQEGTINTTGKYKWDFIPYMNIYEANLDGSDRVALTHGSAYHAECAYSSDGSQIVYASNEDGSMNIYVMNSDGSNVHQLTFTNDCYNGGPFFSPDNSKIVFRADRQKADQLQIYTMNVDGSDLQQLTQNDAINWAPFWHPSGKAIVYTTSIHGHHCYELYLLFTDTGEHRRITHHLGFDGLSTFNVDATKMVWTSKRGADNTSQIFIADFKEIQDL